MQTQLLLPLKHTSKYEGELVYGSCNADAVAWLERFPDWPICFIHLWGPRFSGKTTLAKIYAEKLSGHLIHSNERDLETIPEDVPLIIDHADGAHEETLFHLYNRAAFSKNPFVIFSEKPITLWECHTADMSSRLQTFYEIELKEPDDLTFRLLLLKELGGMGVQFSQAILDLFLERGERSYAFIQAFIKHIEKDTLLKQKSITRGDALSFLAMQNN